MTFTVYGKTATKGSTRSFVRRGHVVTLADNRNLGAWTQAAKWAARQAGASITLKPRAVKVLVTFQFVLPKSVKARAHHTVKPDLDKLLRAVLDALTGIAYEDDAQVVTAVAMKVYGVDEYCLVEVCEVG
jgi:Holliday junction resolvase RusA-like endonuclease